MKEVGENMKNMNIEEFTLKLSSKEAVPGGGGTSALVGALAISLGSMVGSLTLNKKKYENVQEEIQSLMEQAEKLRVLLLEGMKEDAIAFEPLSKAYGIPKTDPKRDTILEECLKKAAQAPFQILNTICSAIDVLERFGQIGSTLAISDAATGAIFAYAALKGAAINVKVNTKLMKDKGYARSLNEQVDKKVEEYGAKAIHVYNRIDKEMES